MTSQSKQQIGLNGHDPFTQKHFRSEFIVLKILDMLYHSVDVINSIRHFESFKFTKIQDYQNKYLIFPTFPFFYHQCIFSFV